MNEFGRLLFLMIAAHAYVDFGVQTDRTSAAKYPGNDTGIPWPIGLSFHALMHGGAVALITGNWLLGVAEASAHAAIDLLKWLGCITPKEDQFTHILCKIVWAIIAING